MVDHAIPRSLFENLVQRVRIGPDIGAPKLSRFAQNSQSFVALAPQRALAYKARCTNRRAHNSEFCNCE
jgi:hypothetical protein